jgi:hypothetical protein
LPRFWPSACLNGHAAFKHGLNLHMVETWVNLQFGVVQSAPFLQAGIEGCRKGHLEPLAQLGKNLQSCSV